MLNRYSYETQSYVNFLTSNKVQIKFPPTRKSHFKLPISNKKKRKKIKATMGPIRSKNDKLKLFPLTYVILQLFVNFLIQIQIKSFYIIFIYPISDLDIISFSLKWKKKWKPKGPWNRFENDKPKYSRNSTIVYVNFFTLNKIRVKSTYTISVFPHPRAIHISTFDRKKNKDKRTKE